MAGKYLLGVTAAAAASQNDTVAEKARLAYLIPVRLMRDVYTAASIVTGGAVVVVCGCHRREGGVRVVVLLRASCMTAAQSDS